jgi:PRTRC genetic system ThiF family protein
VVALARQAAFKLQNNFMDLFNRGLLVARLECEMKVTYGFREPEGQILFRFHRRLTDRIGAAVSGTRAARAVIRDAVGKWSTVSYLVDLGNSTDSGQFVLGEPLNDRNRRSRLRLRTAAELFPEIVDPTLDNDGEPSCSAAAALEAQEPFVNSTLAQHALALLARLFRYGTICYHGGFINLSTGIGSRLPIDTSMWRRFRRRCKSEKIRP